MRLSKPFIVSMLVLLGVLFCAPSASASSSSTAYPFYASEENAGTFWTSEKLSDLLNQINLINTSNYEYIYVNCDNGTAMSLQNGLVFVSTSPLDFTYVSSDWFLQSSSESNVFPFYGKTGKIYLVRYNASYSEISSIEVAWDSFPERLISWRSYGLVSNSDFEYEQSILHVSEFYKKVVTISDPSLVTGDLTSSNLRAKVQGLFKCEYVDTDSGKRYPVRFVSKWYKKNGKVDTEMIQLVIINSSDTGYSYNGYFLFSPRGIGNDYAMTDLKLDIATLDYTTDPDFSLPTVDNSSNSNLLNLTLLGVDENEEVTHTPFPYFATNSNRFNFDIGFDDFRYKGFRYSFDLNSFDSNSVQSFYIDRFYYSPYNVTENSYILDLEFTGAVEKTVIDNTKDDDDSSSIPPAFWNGQNVYSGFDFNSDLSFDFSPLSSFFEVIFNNWVTSLLVSGLSIALISYVIFGKSG